MQKLTRVTLGTGETTMHPGGRYLTSTGACNHRQGFDDAVKPIPSVFAGRFLPVNAEAAGAGGREPAASAARWPPLQLKDVAALHLSATVRPDIRPVAGRKCRALTVAGLARRQGSAVAVMLTRSPPCAGHSVRSGGACGLR